MRKISSWYKGSPVTSSFWRSQNLSICNSHQSDTYKKNALKFVSNLTIATRLLLVSLLLTAATHAQSSDAILHLVDAHYNHLSSLRARYVERYAGMGMTRSESGTLLLKKPGRMAWRYDTPAGKVFLLDGRSAIFYTPGDAQAQRMPAKQLDDLRSPLRFLLGHTELKKELDNISVTPEAANFRIAGVPKGMQDRIKQLSLLITATGLILQMNLEELDGTSTAFAFTDITENLRRRTPTSCSPLRPA